MPLVVLKKNKNKKLPLVCLAFDLLYAFNRKKVCLNHIILLLLKYGLPFKS